MAKETVLKKEVYFIRRINFKQVNFNELENLIEKGVLEKLDGETGFILTTNSEKIKIHKLSECKNRIIYWRYNLAGISFDKKKLLNCLVLEYKKNIKNLKRDRFIDDLRTKLSEQFKLVKKFEKQGEMYLLRYNEIIRLRAIKTSMDIVKGKTKFYIESTTGSYGDKISFDKYGKEFFLTEEDAIKVRKTLSENKCPYCHQEIAVTGVNFCPFCGKEIIDDRDKGVVTIDDIEKRYDLTDKHIWVFNKNHDSLLYDGHSLFSNHFKEKYRDKKFRICLISQLNFMLECIESLD